MYGEEENDESEESSFNSFFRLDCWFGFGYVLFLLRFCVIRLLMLGCFVWDAYGVC